MHILEKLKDDEQCRGSMDGTCAKRKVDIVDEMAEFQSLDKPQRIKSFADLADY